MVSCGYPEEEQSRGNVHGELIGRFPEAAQPSVECDSLGKCGESPRNGGGEQGARGEALESEELFAKIRVRYGEEECEGDGEDEIAFKHAELSERKGAVGESACEYSDE